MEKVQFITHYTERYSYLDSARMAVEGGCRWIQLRMKDAAENEILPVAAEVRKLCNDYGAIFIIDDHVELVKEIRADGVHLGKNDMPVAEARRILGEEYHRRYSQHVRRRKEALARRSKLHRLRTVQIYHHQAETQPYSGFGRI